MPAALSELSSPVRARRAIGLLIVMASALVLVLGWSAHIDIAVRLGPGLAAMVPTTAIGFLLLGGTLWRLDRAPVALPRIAAVTVAAIVLVNLTITHLGNAAGLDGLIITGLADRPHDVMSVATAVCFLMASACTYLSTSRANGARHLLVWIASTGLLICVTALSGYIFDTAALYAVEIFSAMALHTAILMSALFVGLMLSCESGWVWVLLGTGTGSTGARRLFPVVVIGPLMLCFVANEATDAGYMTAEFRIALLAVTMTLLGLVAILSNAQVQNRAESELSTLVDELNVATADLTLAAADKDRLIREINYRVNNNLQQMNALIAIEAARHDAPDVRTSLTEIERQVQALWLVHQLVLNNAHLSQINVAPFLRELAQKIVSHHDLWRLRIDLAVSAEDELISPDTAINLGLLVNDLVANAISHAFLESETGQISIRYETEPEDPAFRRLIVSDNGSNSSDLNSVLERDKSGEMQIIRSLTRQLQGKKIIEIGDGTIVTIRFPAIALQA